MPFWSPLLLVLLGLMLLTLGYLAPTWRLSTYPVQRRPQLRRLRWPLCCSLLMLSGCGTQPLRVDTCPPVPAELMTRPSQPVLLEPGLRLKTLGTTRPSTPASAASTAPATTR